MIKLGTNSIGKIYLGSNSIGKAYLGNDLVFQKGGSPTPPAPTPVFYDRLVFDGTAYIDTDIIPPTNASFRVPIGYESQKVAQRVFMVASSNGTYTGMFYGGNTNTSNRQLVAYYGSSSYVKTKNSSFNYAFVAFFMTPKRFGTGDSTETFTQGSGTPSGPLVIGSIDAHTGQPFTGSCGTFRIYGSDAQNVTTDAELDNYTPTATLRPCTYNGEAGLWCVETSKFYGNTAEAGTLTVLNDS